jgi:multidrug efflux pump subunit AcrA (membrane-fusion protein)
MAITITSPQALQIDGQNYGNVADAIANNRQLAGDIQLALNAWYLALQAEQQQALEIQQTQHETETAELRSQLAGLPTLQSENEALKQQVRSLEAQLDELLHPPQPTQSYLGFYQGLLTEGLNLFMFVRSIADLNLPVSNAYTDLMGSIMFQQFAGFQSSITILFAALKGAGYEFSEPQVAQMRLLLDQHGFANVMFPLGL